MEWRPPDPWSYSYLLGMYLGDGCVSAVRRSYQLVVACDAAYPEIIEDCAAAMTLTLLPRRVRRNPHPVHRCVRVVAASPRWPEVFPQHGPGRKHERRIELAAWQREVVDRFPREFLRAFAGCSASTASGWGSGGRSRTRGTSRSPIGQASRGSTRS